MIYYEIMDSPIGPLFLAEENRQLTHLLFGDNPKIKEKNAQNTCTPLLSECKRQLKEYFAGMRKEFDLPLNPAGTEFQKRDWMALRKIPYGKTCTYKDIAIAIGNEKACRAVGTANHNNPISIIVPCHRVIGSDGSLTGYGGGLDAKKYLLELEQKYAAREEFYI